MWDCDGCGGVCSLGVVVGEFGLFGDLGDFVEGDVVEVDEGIDV